MLTRHFGGPVRVGDQPVARTMVFQDRNEPLILQHEAHKITFELREPMTPATWMYPTCEDAIRGRSFESWAQSSTLLTDRLNALRAGKVTMRRTGQMKKLNRRSFVSPFGLYRSRIVLRSGF